MSRASEWNTTFQFILRNVCKYNIILFANCCSFASNRLRTINVPASRSTLRQNQLPTLGLIRRTIQNCTCRARSCADTECRGSHGNGGNASSHRSVWIQSHPTVTPSAAQHQHQHQHHQRHDDWCRVTSTRARHRLMNECETRTYRRLLMRRSMFQPRQRRVHDVIATDHTTWSRELRVVSIVILPPPPPLCTASASDDIQLDATRPQLPQHLDCCCSPRLSSLESRIKESRPAAWSRIGGVRVCVCVWVGCSLQAYTDTWYRLCSMKRNGYDSRDKKQER